MANGFYRKSEEYCPCFFGIGGLLLLSYYSFSELPWQVVSKTILRILFEVVLWQLDLNQMEREVCAAWFLSSGIEIRQGDISEAFQKYRPCLFERRRFLPLTASLFH